jgi:hypothetical protein
MEDDVTTFINRCVYDVDRILRSALDALRDDLCSEDKDTAGRATKDATEILDWLYPATPAISVQERLKKAKDAINNQALSETEQLVALRRAARSTGRPRGRPRTETAQDAIRAFSMHLATPLSWREIALRVKGCNHKRPSPLQRSCPACGDAIRDAAGRLEKFLLSKGYYSGVPRRLELEPASHTASSRLPKTPGDNSSD